MANSNFFHISDAGDIVAKLMTVSEDMVKYINTHPESTFDLWYKLITHSDLAGRGKRCGTEGIEKTTCIILAFRR